MDDYSVLIEKVWEKLVLAPGTSIPGDRAGTRLLLAGRQALPGLRPLQERRLRIADGPADLDEGRSVTPHAALGEPRRAHVKETGRLFRGQQPFERPCLGGLNAHVGLQMLVLARWRKLARRRAEISVAIIAVIRFL